MPAQTNIVLFTKITGCVVLITPTVEMLNAFYNFSLTSSVPYRAETIDHSLTDRNDEHANDIYFLSNALECDSFWIYEVLTIHTRTDIHIYVSTAVYMCV